MIVGEVINDGLGCTASACSCLYDPYLLFFVVRMDSFVCCFEVASDGHSIVGLEYFAGGEPRIGRVLFG